MKILVMGSNGMAGHMITHYLSEIGHDITALARKRHKNYNTIVGDAMDRDFIYSVIVRGQYDAIVNCIGMLNLGCEVKKADAIYINSYLPHFIAESLAGRKTKFIHISTDCVFSGKTGKYFENSFKDGCSFYDRTKALGEIDDDKNVTFRNSIIGPEQNIEGIGLMNWFLQSDKEVMGYRNTIWSGVTTIVLAQAIECAIKTNLCGIYHLVNNFYISKFDLLQLMNEHIREKKIDIVADDKYICDKSLNNTRTDFPFEVPNYKDMIIELGNWMRLHKELYPHYYK